MNNKMIVIDDEVENINIFKLRYGAKWNVLGIETPHELLKEVVFMRESLPDIIFLDLLFEQDVPKEEEQIKIKFETGNILGMKFLDFIQFYMGTVPVIVMSGIIYPFIWEHIKQKYPYVKCLSKPTDVTSKEFEQDINRYSKGYYSNKMDHIGQGLAPEPHKMFTNEDFQMFDADFVKQNFSSYKKRT